MSSLPSNCFSVPHELLYVVGCFMNGTAEVQFEYDAEEMLYVDFQREEIVYTVPRFLNIDPSQALVGLSILRDALMNKNLCLSFTTLAAAEEKNPPEEKGKGYILVCCINLNVHLCSDMIDEMLLKVFVF